MAADETSDEGNLGDVFVTIGHPFGDVEVPLSEWMIKGPGPRSLVRPVRARSGSTGRPLPLTVIPLRYRNNGESRRAIREGRIDDPWPAMPPDLPDPLGCAAFGCNRNRVIRALPDS